jgi:hypothetical protein
MIGCGWRRLISWIDNLGENCELLQERETGE